MDQVLSADEIVRETRHRVKNSLQLVVSMLSAQARQSNEPSLIVGLREAISRIVAVSHLHENLQNSCEQVAQVDDYLRDICNDLALTAGAERGWIRLHADAVVLPGPDALALGLIANELVTNALRHAYPAGGGPVDVTLGRDDRCIVLTVADQGVGGVVGVEAGEGLGLTLVRQLARKLHAEIEMSDAGPGMRVRLSFAEEAAAVMEPAFR